MCITREFADRVDVVCFWIRRGVYGDSNYGDWGGGVFSGVCYKARTGRSMILIKKLIVARRDAEAQFLFLRVLRALRAKFL